MRRAIIDLNFHNSKVFSSNVSPLRIMARYPTSRTGLCTYSAQCAWHISKFDLFKLPGH